MLGYQNSSQAIYIQAQDLSGVWRTISVTINDPQVILLQMSSVKRQFPNFRIRAINSSGSLVDLLG